METMNFRVKCNPNPKPAESYHKKMADFWVTGVIVFLFAMIPLTDQMLILLSSLEEIEYNEMIRIINHFPGSRGKYEGDEWNHKMIGWRLHLERHYKLQKLEMH